MRHCWVRRWTGSLCQRTETRWYSCMTGSRFQWPTSSRQPAAFLRYHWPSVSTSCWGTFQRLNPSLLMPRTRPLRSLVFSRQADDMSPRTTEWRFVLVLDDSSLLHTLDLALHTAANMFVINSHKTSWVAAGCGRLGMSRPRTRTQLHSFIELGVTVDSACSTGVPILKFVGLRSVQ